MTAGCFRASKDGSAVTCVNAASHCLLCLIKEVLSSAVEIASLLRHFSPVCSRIAGPLVLLVPFSFTILVPTFGLVDRTFLTSVTACTFGLEGPASLTSMQRPLRGRAELREETHSGAEGSSFHPIDRVDEAGSEDRPRGKLSDCLLPDMMVILFFSIIAQFDPLVILE